MVSKQFRKVFGYKKLKKSQMWRTNRGRCTEYRTNCMTKLAPRIKKECIIEGRVTGAGREVTQIFLFKEGEATKNSRRLDKVN